MMLEDFLDGSPQNLVSNGHLIFLFAVHIRLLFSHGASFLVENSIWNHTTLRSVHLLLCLFEFFPLFLQVELLFFDRTVFLQQFQLNVIHLVEFFSNGILIFHVIGQQGIVLVILLVVIFEHLVLILNIFLNTSSICFIILSFSLFAYSLSLFAILSASIILRLSLFIA